MKKIAVVEDNPDNRLLVRVILEAAYDISEYEDGFAALAGLQWQRPDLVLLDVSLPEMDGTEVLRRIRADARLRSLPVIALTAHAMAGDREKYLGQGFDEYVAKPIVDENVLLRAIEQALRREPAAKAEPGGSVAGSDSPLPPVDPAALDHLSQLGGSQFVCEMIALFCEYTAKKLTEARTAHAAGNLEALQKAAHPVKSSAGNIGALQVQQLAERLEAAAKAGQVGMVGEELARLEAAFAVASERLGALKPQFNDGPVTSRGN
jgi:CheY-like chemotaxis protein/HPt (histidine-containing phosphotransfer) domain-containing protein